MKFLFKFFTRTPQVKQFSFILTKPFTDSKGNSKGDLVLRVEHIVRNNLLCSKGKFSILSGKLEWSFDDGQRLIEITKDDLKKVLNSNQAYLLLEERVKRVSN